MLSVMNNKYNLNINIFSHSRLRRILAVSLFFFALGVCAQTKINLYPADSCRRARKVTLEAYPSDKSSMAVVVCPGGSYFWLDYENEGVSVAKYLQSQGISAFVLRYRVGGWWSWALHYRTAVRGNQAPDMYNDGQAALCWVRDHAAQYGIDTARIGIMGFSAGGHLAMSQAVVPTGFHPAFVAPIYPVVTMVRDCVHKRSRRGLLGDSGQRNEARRLQWSIENHIPDNCVPVFLVNCVDDDVVDYRNSVLLDSALTLHKVNHRYIQYRTGGHGFGVSDTKGSSECHQWRFDFIEWLKENNL